MTDRQEKQGKPLSNPQKAMPSNVENQNHRLIQIAFHLFSGRRYRLVSGLRQLCPVFERPQHLSVVTTLDQAMEPSATTAFDFQLE